DEELLEWCGDSFDPVSRDVVPDVEKISLLRELVDSCATRKELADGVRRELSWAAQIPDDGVPQWFTALSGELAAIDGGEWRAPKIKDALRGFAREKGLKGKELFHPVRILLTGSSQGAPLDIILSCVGKEQTLKRFRHYPRHEIS
ncbi:MAG: hypothetical protein LBB28_06610, partial [Synergistaceae bacterium]|nr:hypothetical protein [Synergistaceae bacterium]